MTKIIFIYPRDRRAAYEWCRYHWPIHPIRLHDCEDCGCTTTEKRCGDCEKELGSGDA